MLISLIAKICFIARLIDPNSRLMIEIFISFHFLFSLSLSLLLPLLSIHYFLHIFNLIDAVVLLFDAIQWWCVRLLIWHIAHTQIVLFCGLIQPSVMECLHLVWLSLLLLQLFHTPTAKTTHTHTLSIGKYIDIHLHTTHKQHIKNRLFDWTLDERNISASGKMARYFIDTNIDSVQW